MDGCTASRFAGTSCAAWLRATPHLAQHLAFQEETDVDHLQDHLQERHTSQSPTLEITFCELRLLVLLLLLQQHEAVKIRCKIPAGANLSQNVEDHRASHNGHFLYVSSQHTCPITGCLW